MASNLALLEKVHEALKPYRLHDRLEEDLTQQMEDALHLSNSNVSATSLAIAWTNRTNREWVLQTLERCHPCVTAVLLTQCLHDKIITGDDATVIANALVDRKVEENIAHG